MKFEKAEGTVDLKSRIVCNGIEIGLYPVIFGFRVRVSIEGDEFCQLDLCGGNNVEMIDLLYNGIRQILEGQLRENGVVDYNEFPIQHRKPYFKDMDFLKDFCDLILKYREHDILDTKLEITQANLNACRMEYGLMPI